MMSTCTSPPFTTSQAELLAARKKTSGHYDWQVEDKDSEAYMQQGRANQGCEGRARGDVRFGFCVEFSNRQRDGLVDGREDQQRGVRTREGGLGFGHKRGAGREQVSGEMVGKSEGEEGGRSSIFSLFTQRSLRR